MSACHSAGPSLTKGPALTPAESHFLGAISMAVVTRAQRPVALVRAQTCEAGGTNGQIVGLAHTDNDLVEFLRRAGLDDAWDLLDDAHWVEWRGGRAHRYEAA